MSNFDKRTPRIVGSEISGKDCITVPNSAVYNALKEVFGGGIYFYPITTPSDYNHQTAIKTLTDTAQPKKNYQSSDTVPEKDSFRVRDWINDDSCSQANALEPNTDYYAVFAPMPPECSWATVCKRYLETPSKIIPCGAQGLSLMVKMQMEADRGILLRPTLFSKTEEGLVTMEVSQSQGRLFETIGKGKNHIRIFALDMPDRLPIKKDHVLLGQQPEYYNRVVPVLAVWYAPKTEPFVPKVFDIASAWYQYCDKVDHKGVYLLWFIKQSDVPVA